MALTRKMLKAMGIEDDKAEQIIEAHTETIEGLRAFKADAERLPEVQAQLEAAQAALEAAQKDGFKGKYDVLKGEFDAFKASVEAEKSRGAKESAYRTVLKTAGLPDTLLDRIVAVSGSAIDTLELDDRGAAKNSAQLVETVKTEWADFIPSTSVRGAAVETPPAAPPAPDYDAMSDAEYYAATAAKKG